jgi:hypothetical protein
MKVNEQRECDLRSEEAVRVKRAGLSKPPMGRLSPRLRLIVTNIAKFCGPANKSSLPAFLFFRGYRFVGDVLDFARRQLRKLRGRLLWMAAATCLKRAASECD